MTLTPQGYLFFIILGLFTARWIIGPLLGLV
jgi:hypothetical protein